MATDKDKALAKIKKCLALANSGDGNEAATALRQAQSLMKKYGLTDTHIKLSAITQGDTKRHKTQKPNSWQDYLISIIKKAFGVDAVITSSRIGYFVTFIGTDAEVDLAGYCYAVLYRKLESDRKAFMDALPRQTKRQNRIRRADLYAQGWCAAVYTKLPTLPMDEARNELVSLYKEHNDFGSLSTYEARQRTIKNDRDLDSAYRGHQDGKEVDIHRPVHDHSNKTIKRLTDLGE